MDQLLQLGLGGAVAVLLVREVLRYLSQRRENGLETARRVDLAGEKSVEFWTAQQVMNTTTVVNAVVVPILSRQTEILQDMNRTLSRFSEQILKIQFQMDASQKGNP